jgi:hypothetical protein
VLVLQSGQKLTLGRLATITLEGGRFHTYAQFPELLPLLKCILEVVFSTTCDSASITSFA